MSLIDKVVAAVSPAGLERVRGVARAGAACAASCGDWLEMVLEHHRYIESAFRLVASAQEEAGRIRAQRRLAALLVGHANAEETVLYPALARAEERGHAASAYSEQATIRMRMALLESMPAMSRAYHEALEDLRTTVVRHMYEEESTWFLEIKAKVPAVEQIRLSQRYEQEFHRYVGDEPAAARSPRSGMLEPDSQYTYSPRRAHESGKIDQRTD